ncbi:hypothetical protein [Gallaecimonas pentaromativorans]|uniref:Lipoprotein n=2 Tax=Gallaecimonas pentaromativorans TaxID=584787 RepID=A0A3N1PGY6_9GAMM|nr:hypothetical protein [Gallaecimonas pentaromativorans]ROQ30722.1 hypothetical protein EDC28_101414 [Gallaecimonas pentaromativorans]
MKRTLLLLLLLLSACTPAPPGQEALKEALRAHLGALGPDAFLEIENVTLLDSKRLDDNHIQVALAYQVRFTENFPDAARALATGQPDMFARFGSSLGAMALKMEFGVFRKGDLLERQDSLQLVRNDKGQWLLASPA